MSVRQWVCLGSFVLTAFAAVGCVTVGNDDDTQLNITDTSEDQFSPVAFGAQDGLAAYKGAGADQRAEWLACKLKAPKASILVMHQDRAGYAKDKFCSGWIAQTFLSQGFNVIAVNRPGYGASTGAPDFSGDLSMLALDAATKDAIAKSGSPALEGAWGYSSGAMAAALVSRRLGSLKFLILGGGVYDLEETLKKTTDSYLKKDIETIQRTGGSEAVESRSVAYDVSGLPKRIAIYHGKQDTVVLPSQAKAFADSLESSGEYKVTFQVIDGVRHEIPWAHHRKILEVLAASVR